MLAPRFLGHVSEHGRIIGLLLEKAEEVREARIEDLAFCEEAVERLHTLGLAHGDLNRFNFFVTEDSIKLIGFENSSMEVDGDYMRRESEGLSSRLQEETGRGGGFRISKTARSMNFVQLKYPRLWKPIISQNFDFICFSLRVLAPRGT